VTKRPVSVSRGRDAEGVTGAQLNPRQEGTRSPWPRLLPST
jgi:hypothetical protein